MPSADALAGPNLPGHGGDRGNILHGPLCGNAIFGRPLVLAKLYVLPADTEAKSRVGEAPGGGWGRDG